MTTRSRPEASATELFFTVTMGAFVSFFVVFVCLWATLCEGYTELLQWPDMLIFVAVPTFVFWLFGRKSKWNWEFDGRCPLLIGVTAGMAWGYYVLEADYSEKELLYCGYISEVDQNCIALVKKRQRRYSIDYLYTKSLHDNEELYVAHEIYECEPLDASDFNFKHRDYIKFGDVLIDKKSELLTPDSQNEDPSGITVFLVSKIERFKDDTISDKVKATIRAHLRGDCPDAIVRRREYIESFNSKGDETKRTALDILNIH